MEPFHVPRHAFTRDVLFFTTAVVVLITVLHDGHLTVMESGGMVVLYLAYVGVVVAGNWWSSRQRLKNQTRARSYDQETRLPIVETIIPDPTSDSPNIEIPPPPTMNSPSDPSPITSPRSKNHRSISQIVSSHSSPHLGTTTPFHDAPRANFSLLGAIEFRDVVNSLRKESESRAGTPSRTPKSPILHGERGDYFGVVNYSHRRSVSQGIGSMRTESSAKRKGVMQNSVVGEESGPSTAYPAAIRRADSVPAQTSPELNQNPWSDQPGKPGRPRVKTPRDYLVDNTIPSISITEPTGLTGPPPPETSILPTRNFGESRFRIRRHTRLVLRVLFPSLQSFRRKSYLGKIIAIVSVPAILALTLSLPVVDQGQSEGAVALPITDDGPLFGEPELEPGVIPDADEDRLLSSNVGEELHHLVDSGFSPLHSPMGRLHHSDLHRLHDSGRSESGMSKELLEEIHQEEALDFHKWLAAVQCVLGPMFCELIILRKSSLVRQS